MTFHLTKEVTVRRSWASRIALLDALEAGTILLYDTNDNLVYLRQLPLGIYLHIKDPTTGRAVTVTKNATRTRGRQGLWHVI